MKQILVTIIFYCLATCTLQAQDNDSPRASKNIIKLNLGALAFKNASGQYERAVGPRISVATTIRYMPTGLIPLKSIFTKLTDDPEVERQLSNFRVGNFAVMPELRFYPGKKGALSGFYLGPFVSFARYNADLLFEYGPSNAIETIPMKGDVTTLTGGIMIGAQWKLSKVIMLDWWIAGPHYGTSNGDISGSKKLDAGDQQLLRDELDDLDVPLTKFTYVVDANGATVNFKGPWAGIRSGICIGVRF